LRLYGPNNHHADSREDVYGVSLRNMTEYFESEDAWDLPFAVDSARTNRCKISTEITLDLDESFGQT